MMVQRFAGLVLLCLPLQDIYLLYAKSTLGLWLKLLAGWILVAAMQSLRSLIPQHQYNPSKVCELSS